MVGKPFRPAITVTTFGWLVFPDIGIDGEPFKKNLHWKQYDNVFTDHICSVELSGSVQERLFTVKHEQPVAFARIIKLEDDVLSILHLLLAPIQIFQCDKSLFEPASTGFWLVMD